MLYSYFNQIKNKFWYFTCLDIGCSILALNWTCFLFPAKSFFAATVIFGIFIIGESIRPETITSSKACSNYAKKKSNFFYLNICNLFINLKKRVKLTFIFPSISKNNWSPWIVSIPLYRLLWISMIALVLKVLKISKGVFMSNFTKCTTSFRLFLLILYV